MKLRPISSTGETRYPTYDSYQVTKRWLKRTATVGAASLALLIGGCGSEEETPAQPPFETLHTGGVPRPPVDAAQQQQNVQGNPGDSGTQATAPDAAVPESPPPVVRSGGIARPAIQPNEQLQLPPNHGGGNGGTATPDVPARPDPRTRRAGVPRRPQPPGKQ